MARTKKSPSRSIIPDDLLRFRLIASPRISPSGESVVFVVKTVGDKKGKYQTNLWIVPASAGEPRQFTSGGKDRSPEWSPEGGRIAFLAEREENRPQIHVINAAGGEATPLTKFPEGSFGRFVWSPRGDRLAVAFREQNPEWTQEAKKRRKEAGESDPPRVVDDWWYRLDGDGYFLQQRYHLYLVDAARGEHRKLYDKDTLGGFDFDFSPDGNRLVVATNRSPMALVEPWKDELVLIDVESGKAKPLKGPPAGPKTCVRWSPDGKHIAWAGREGGTDGVYSTENLEAWCCDADGGNSRSLTGGEDFCLLAVAVTDAAEAEFAPWLRFSPGGERLFLRIGMQGRTHVASVPVGGGKLTFHTDGDLSHDPGNFSANGAGMALTVGSPRRLPEVAVAAVRKNSFRVEHRSDLNGPLFSELKLAEPEEHWTKAEDGSPVHFWVLRPPGAGRNQKSPAVLEIHGGPHAQYGVGFFHEFQVLAAAGYAVFYGNPRGSKGYGRDHCAAIRGDWGCRDWADVRAMIEFMKSQPFVDAARMGVMGGSYGGYMTNWAIGHCDDFAAAITDRCVSNLVSMGGNSDYPDTPDQYFPGNFWDRPEERWRQSPIRYLGNAKAPTLVIHSEGDLRCNVEQGEQVFTALKLMGVETRLVRYPASTSHGMSRQGPPDLRIHRLRQILAWWQSHLA